MHPFVAAFADELVKTGAAAARSMLTPGSSNVRGFRYDPATKEMFVTFKGGGTYRYSDVPPAAARSIRRAKSVGKAVNKHLKGGGYAYEKIGMPAATIAKIVRRTLEKDPDRVGKFISRTKFPGAKRIALDEARAFMAGTPQFAGKRKGNVLKPVAGEGIKTANGDMWQYYADHPEKLRAKRKRDAQKKMRKAAGIPIREWGRDVIRDIVARVLNYREERFGGRQPRRHRKHASAPVGAESIEASFRSMRKLAGVAKKQITWQGLRMKIEHEPGDIRSGKSKDGKTWERTMFDSYGYIPGTKGKAADGDAIDVYFAKDPVDGPVFKVRQLKKDTGEYDEDKFMVGFGSAENAKKAYLRHMPAWALGDISSVGKTFEDFKTFVES